MQKKEKALKSDKIESINYTVSYIASFKNNFPDLPKSIKELSDFRSKNKCKYDLKALFFMSLIVVGMYGSRKAYNDSLKKIESKDFLNNALDLNLKSIPDGDTLAYFWNNIETKNFESIIHKMSNKLIRSRQLEPYRLGIYYLIAIDTSAIAQ